MWLNVAAPQNRPRLCGLATGQLKVAHAQLNNVFLQFLLFYSILLLFLRYLTNGGMTINVTPLCQGSEICRSRLTVIFEFLIGLYKLADLLFYFCVLILFK